MGDRRWLGAADHCLQKIKRHDLDQADDSGHQKTQRAKRGRPRLRPYSSRCTVSMENAGRQTAMYSAPSGLGVEYCTHSPACAMTA